MNATKDRKYGGSAASPVGLKKEQSGNRTGKGAGTYFNSLAYAGNKMGGKKKDVIIKKKA